MSWRPRACVFALALGFLGTPTLAKPPDLPAKPTIICVTATPEATAEESEQRFQNIDVTSPCFWEVFQSYWRSWSLSLMECFSGSDTPTEAAPAQLPQTSSQLSMPYTCPYFQQKIATSAGAGSESVSLPVSVLDNLERLEKAQEAFRQAERCRRQGQTALASFYYEQTRKICPGSRFALQATGRLNELRALTITETTAGAEERETSPPKPEHPQA